MRKPTGPIVIGQFPCVICHRIRKTALGAWACWKMHRATSREAMHPTTHAYVLGTGRLK